MKKLRIAIVIDSQNYFTWHNTLVSNLLNSEFVELVLKLDFDDGIGQIKNSENHLPLLWKSFLKLDSKLFASSNDALSPKVIHYELEHIDCISNNKNLTNDILNPYHLDLILNLTDIVTPKNLINSSKHGVWFLTHCDIDKINKRPFGIWEMLEKVPETVAVLRTLQKNTDLPKTIDKTSSCTDSLSYLRNVNDIYWQALSLIYTNIELLCTNEALFYKKIESHSFQFSNTNVSVTFQPPSNIKILKYGLSLYFKKIFQVVKSKFYIDQWALIFYNNKNNSDPYSLKDYMKILPPKDRFWADPFLVKKDNTYYLFIEELIYKNKLGHLAVMTIDKDGNYSKPENILVKDYHLSYPNVFEDNGDYYMIPETSGNNDIQLYKCTEFPLKWELEKVLMKEVVAVDTTIYKENDMYWMFTNIKKVEGGSKHVELFLFSSKELNSDKWQPHPLNPIVSDIKKSRPAGAIFKKNNKLFRPSQNCSNYYGYGLNISEITKLDQTNFEEQIVKAIEPNWDKAIGSTHTFNMLDDLCISDISIRRNRFF